MDRRGFARVAATGVWLAVGPRPAAASLARAVGLEELVARSRHVLVAEALDAESAWEQVGKRRHIVTRTRVAVRDVLGGAAPEREELMVRTLGGQVGDLGELVHGEAALGLGARGVLFVMLTRGELMVTAMAQGHYPLARDKLGAERLRRSPAARELVGESGAAVERLPGLSLASARSLLQQVRK